ncbi:pilus assembly protein [Bradyrhizobium sp. ISRA443]|uniref:TadE/TadG family type IV pilus assembly protein n=1 Tax=unclassified Bradyrhizobium TaxID=2631580 RepID=UPI00247A5B3D|nr:MULTISPECIES: TadE/TadG family type IV pilus assembly protein [unclassified Bradyrhizobium]WGR95588.1 pilus assembly protein [Bradyrhizobium sp. ISRA435]WGS00646.1 pilus assembly protein [Bradyrhizobium sp. ISRA436]WGS07534.1 pilus assembly protein [Bradyrhizobium sp. ISRA437]WGS14421.1 pilus assembly protein [Bradyrhizobium sp. ISRA443]
MKTGNACGECRSHRRRGPRRLLGRFRKNTRGAAAIEFGILVPLLTLMVVSVVDIGLAVYRKMQVESAAQAGVEYAIAHGFDSNAMSAAVVNATNSTAISASPAPVKFCGCATTSGVTSTTCGSTCPGGAQAGTYTTVSAQGSYWTIINYQVVPSGYSLSMQSTVRLQ